MTMYRPHERVQHDLSEYIDPKTGEVIPNPVKQEMKSDCDINRIMKKFEREGVVDFSNAYQGTYGSFIDAPDFHEASNLVTEARQLFADLPAQVRKRFANDPAQFLEFMDNPSENAEEMEKLGLAKLIAAEEAAQSGGKSSTTGKGSKGPQKGPKEPAAPPPDPAGEGATAQ